MYLCSVLLDTEMGVKKEHSEHRQVFLTPTEEHEISDKENRWVERILSPSDKPADSRGSESSQF